jgi:hypothetical protein
VEQPLSDPFLNWEKNSRTRTRKSRGKFAQSGTERKTGNQTLAQFPACCCPPTGAAPIISYLFIIIYYSNNIIYYSNNLYYSSFCISLSIISSSSSKIDFISIKEQESSSASFIRSS